MLQILLDSEGDGDGESCVFTQSGSASKKSRQWDSKIVKLLELIFSTLDLESQIDRP